MRYRKTRLAILAAAVVLGAVLFSSTSSSATGAGLDPVPQKRGRAAARGAPKASAPRPRVDYSRFSHKTEAHRRSCEACHTFPSANWKDIRARDAAFPDVTEYPQHASCLECHRQQFFARERPAPPICSVCHVAVTPRSTARLPFPNPAGPFLASTRGREFVSDFRVSFPHEMHLGLLGNAREPETHASGAQFTRVSIRDQAANRAGACVTCHRFYQPQGDSDDEYTSKPPRSLGDGYWLKKGTFQTAPEGHDTCFTCHSADSGLKPAPADCATCHRPARSGPGAAVGIDFDPTVAAAMGVADPVTLQKWRRRNCSATFRHEGGMHPEQACTNCHDVASMDTTDDRSAKVAVLSCSGCHITATLDDGGALNFEIDQRRANPTFECVKCHLAYATAPVPQSHSNAVAKAKTD